MAEFKQSSNRIVDSNNLDYDKPVFVDWHKLKRGGGKNFKKILTAYYNYSIKSAK